LKKAFLFGGGRLLSIGFIGAGTVGTSLAYRLRARGYNIAAVVSRTYASAEKLALTVSGCQPLENPQDVVDVTDLVFITTPDGAIGQIAAQLKWRSGQSVVHCSGADSTAILRPAHDQGAQVGAFHPLQTFAGIKQAIENIPGSTFAIEAEEPLKSILRQMANDLEGYSIELKQSDKVLYHASAVMACNYLVTLVKLATDLWQNFGIPRQDAVRALMPLLKGTLNNLGNIGIPDCLTGPVARGDFGTVEKHLSALDKTDPDVAAIYRQLGLQTVPIALDKGKLSGEQANRIRDILESSPVSTR
jgi:predicted short-subunit dehydrogenase-like oxidoreductase (DUF2520 family)